MWQHIRCTPRVQSRHEGHALAADSASAWLGCSRLLLPATPVCNSLLLSKAAARSCSLQLHQIRRSARILRGHHSNRQATCESAAQMILFCPGVYLPARTRRWRPSSQWSWRTRRQQQVGARGSWMCQSRPQAPQPCSAALWQRRLVDNFWSYARHRLAGSHSISLSFFLGSGRSLSSHKLFSSLYCVRGLPNSAVAQMPNDVMTCRIELMELIIRGEPGDATLKRNGDASRATIGHLYVR